MGHAKNSKSKKSKNSTSKKSSKHSKRQHHANRSMSAKYDPKRLLQQIPFSTSGVSVTSTIQIDQKDTGSDKVEIVDALDLDNSELMSLEVGTSHKPDSEEIPIVSHANVNEERDVLQSHQVADDQEGDGDAQIGNDEPIGSVVDEHGPVHESAHLVGGQQNHNFRFSSPCRASVIKPKVLICTAQSNKIGHAKNPKSKNLKNSKSKKSPKHSKRQHHANRSMPAKYDPKRLLQLIPFSSSGVSVTSTIHNNEKETRADSLKIVEALDLEISELLSLEVGTSHKPESKETPIVSHANVNEERDVRESHQVAVVHEGDGDAQIGNDEPIGRVVDEHGPVHEGAHLAGGQQINGRANVRNPSNYLSRRARRNRNTAQNIPRQIVYRGVIIGNIGADKTVPNWSRLRTLKESHHKYLANWANEATAFVEYLHLRPDGVKENGNLIQFIDSIMGMIANITMFDQFLITREAISNAQEEIEKCVAKIMGQDITTGEMFYLCRWADYAAESAAYFACCFKKSPRINNVLESIKQVMGQIGNCTTWQEYKDVHESIVRLTRVMDEFNNLHLAYLW